MSLTDLLDAITSGGRQLGSTVLLTGFDDCFDGSDASELSSKLGVLQAKHQRHSHAFSVTQILDTLDASALPSGSYGYRAPYFQSRARVRRVQPAQRNKLQQILDQQKQTVIDLCKKHQVPCVDHLGPVTETSIDRLVEAITEHGVFA